MSEPFWVPLGGAGVDYKGAWAAGTQYQPGDVVRSGGVDYLAVNPSLGTNPGVATGMTIPYARLRDEKASSVAAGASSATTWHRRDLTVKDDPQGIVTLASHQFTLQAGTYRIRASAPGRATGRHKLRLRNVTDGTDTMIGTNEYSGLAPTNAVTRAQISGRFTLAAAKTFELQHFCEVADVLGLGVASDISGVIEVYAVVELWKEA